MLLVCFSTFFVSFHVRTVFFVSGLSTLKLATCMKRATRAQCSLYGLLCISRFLMPLLTECSVHWWQPCSNTALSYPQSSLLFCNCIRPDCSAFWRGSRCNVFVFLFLALPFSSHFLYILCKVISESNVVLTNESFLCKDAVEFWVFFFFVSPVCEDRKGHVKAAVCGTGSLSFFCYMKGYSHQVRNKTRQDRKSVV